MTILTAGVTVWLWRVNEREWLQRLAWVSRGSPTFVPNYFASSGGAYIRSKSRRSAAAAGIYDNALIRNVLAGLLLYGRASGSYLRSFTISAEHRSRSVLIGSRQSPITPGNHNLKLHLKFHRQALRSVVLPLPVPPEMIAEVLPRTAAARTSTSPASARRHRRAAP